MHASCLFRDLPRRLISCLKQTALLLALLPILGASALQAQGIVFQPTGTQTDVIDFGTTAVGAVGQRQTLNFSFTTNTLFNQVDVVSGGAPMGNASGKGLDFVDEGDGSCDRDVANGFSPTAGFTCTVNITFTPTASGLRTGAVVLSDALGKTLLTVYIFGAGTGPQAIFLGGTNPATTLFTLPNGSFFGRLLRDQGGNFYSAVSSSPFPPGGPVYVFIPQGNGTYQQSRVSENGDLAALDGAGNVFLSSGNSVLKETPDFENYGAFTESVVATGIRPDVVAVDRRGDVYIADNSANVTPGAANTVVYKAALQNGAYTLSTFLTGQAQIGSIAFDTAGKLIFGSNGDGIAAIATDSPAVAAARAAHYTGPLISSPQGNLYFIQTPYTIALINTNAMPVVADFQAVPADALTTAGFIFVANIGTDPLVFTAAATATPGAAPALPEGYLLDPVSSCPGYSLTAVSNSLGARSNCLVALDFKAVQPSDGVTPSLLTLVDNNLNVQGSTQSIRFTRKAPPSLPSLVSPRLPDGLLDKPYFAALVATGGVPPYTFQGTNPMVSDLALSSSGLLTGVPLFLGQSQLGVKVTDSVGSSVVVQLPISVNALQISVTPAGPFTALLGTPFSQQITAQGGIAPYRFGISSGNLPAGLKLSDGGLLSGTPATAGFADFIISVQDSSPTPNIANVPLRIVVSANLSGPAIDASKGFSPALGLYLNGSATITGANLSLTDGNVFEAASAWSSTPVSIRKFTTDFQFQLNNAQADGFTFALQNGRPTALGYSGGDLGYTTIPASAAVKFDLFNNYGEQANSVGFFANGTMPTFPSSVLLNGLDLKSGHVFGAHLIYDGISLTLTITDTVTKASSTFSQVLDLPTAIDSPTAYVGFTAGTGALTAKINILNWTYTATP